MLCEFNPTSPPPPPPSKRKRIHPFPWSQAPSGESHRAAQVAHEHRMLGTQHTHTHSRGHFNIIRYKAIIQAISLSLMICQHSLSVFFPTQILSCIANFSVRMLAVQANSHFSTITISRASAVTRHRGVLTGGQVEGKSEPLQAQNDGNAKGLLMESQEIGVLIRPGCRNK